MNQRVIIIAEAGVNHNGQLSLAKALVDAAKDAGADYIKFQTFSAEKLVSAEAKKAVYQQDNDPDGEETQLTMLQKLELTEAQHQQLFAYCEERQIRFLSTAFDLQSIDLLERLNLDFLRS